MVKSVKSADSESLGRTAKARRGEAVAYAALFAIFIMNEEPTPLEEAKIATRNDSAGHWPTVAAVLLEEVERLEKQIKGSSASAGSAVELELVAAYGDGCAVEDLVDGNGNLRFDRMRAANRLEGALVAMVEEIKAKQNACREPHREES